MIKQQYLLPLIAEKEIGRIIEFARSLAESLGIYFQVGVSFRTRGANDHVTKAVWVGDVPPSIASKAPHYVLRKLAELMALEIVLPKEGRSWEIGPVDTSFVKGAIRGVDDWVDVTIAVSKLDQNHDLLVAAILFYAYFFQKGGVYPIRLHHAGAPVSEAAYARTKVATDVKVMERPAGDHQRIYVRREGQPYYQEFQLWPDETGGVKHWDFVAYEYQAFLAFLGMALEMSPEFWEEEPNAPVGMLNVPGKDSPTDHLAVMVRPYWWAVEED